MVGHERFERSTNGLKVRCSTGWANDPWRGENYNQVALKKQAKKLEIALRLFSRQFYGIARLIFSMIFIGEDRTVIFQDKDLKKWLKTTFRDIKFL